MNLGKWWILDMKWQDLCDFSGIFVGHFVFWVFDKLDPWHSFDKGLWRDTDKYMMTSPREAKEEYLKWKEVNK